MTLVFRCKLTGNGAALKIYLSERVVVEIQPSPSLFLSSSSFANERTNEEALTSVEGANAAIQSVCDYKAGDEKQPAYAAVQRWVGIMPLGFLFRERLNDRSHN